MKGSPSLKTLLWIAAAAGGLAVGAAQAEDRAGDGGVTRHRLFIGDHAEGIVRAVDLETGTGAGTFRIDQTPALTRSVSGRTVFAVQGDAGKVAVIGTGLAFEDHGDHSDITIDAATLLPTVITGTKPAHLVEGSGIIALFDDGTGGVALFRESEALAGAVGTRRLTPGAAHHGLAAPMGDFLVVSVADDDPRKPRVGLRVIDAEGKPVGGVVTCPGVHGQAQSGRVFAFGCKDGVVFAQPGGGGKPPTLRHVSTTALGDGNVSTLKGGTALQVFLGNYGPRAVVIIEPGAEPGFRKVELPTRRVDFALDDSKPDQAYILTEDGRLHRLNILSGAIETSVQLTAPYSMDGHWRDPRPRLAVAGDHVAVTDPLKGVVRLVSAATLTEERTIAVAGTPYSIVAVGGSGATH